MRRILTTFAIGFLLGGISAFAAVNSWTITSPSGKLSVNIENGADLTYSVSYDGNQLVNPSPISVKLTDGTFYGGGAKLRKATVTHVDDVILPVVYDKAEIPDIYNELNLAFKDFSLVVRAYDEGIAWRFVTGKKTETYVESEQVEIDFPGDWKSWVPYVKRGADGSFEDQFFNSFENYYTITPLSGWNPNRLAFMPVLVQTPEGLNICITESNLLNYPGMYLNGLGGTTLKGVMSAVPDEVLQGGYHQLQGMVQTRKDYIAKLGAGEALPWRVIMVAPEDKQLADMDLVYKLADAPEDRDWSWVKPGKVAWDWWNDWNIYGVDFKAGINNDTYKYYIDFASAHGIEYVILDEGWAVNLQADLFQVIPEIDLQMLADYAKSRNVGLILWAGYWAFNRDIEKVCSHYSEMGIKGFKVDFMDRDDQEMVQFYAKAAQVAAKYNLLLDFHGAFKPSGLTRTWPNVLNFEGIAGLEQMKWATDDQVTYDVTIPFIRYAAGPADYTQGAMRNAIKKNYRPINSEPMSPGTRCHQIAEYMIFDAPLTMMCDSPSNYMREPECTEFISSIPTVWENTIVLDGKLGEYVVTARKDSNGNWWLGALNGWTPRELTIDLSFLGDGDYDFEAFMDGVNADRAARDFKQVLGSLNSKTITIKLAPGGGYASHYMPR